MGRVAFYIEVPKNSTEMIQSSNMDVLFILLSGLYVISLAVLDGVWNRLVFRQDRKLSYFSSKKQKIYALPEWKVVGILFLIVLPLVIPLFVAYVLGGIRYDLVYLLIMLLVDWDIIFGKIVFDDWFGDLPSIPLPLIGWLHFNLLQTIIVRLILSAVILLILFKQLL